MSGPGAAGRGQSERGLALVIVLVVLALLLSVVGELARSMRVESATTANFRDVMGATQLARAGYEQALAEILPDALSLHLDERGRLVFRRDRLTPPEVPPRIDLVLGRGRYSYRITDEQARLNVNRVSPDLLRRLLGELDVDPGTRDTVVDSIQDWRDPNEEYRLNGAESDYYQGLPVPYRSKNGDFDSVDELAQVKGVTPSLLRGRPEAPGLAELLTVAGNGAVNVNTASRIVLQALGFASAEAQLIEAGRPYLDLAALSTQLRRGNLRVTSDTFRIEAWGELPGQGRRKLTAVVQRQGGGGGTVRILPLSWTWTDGAPPPPATEATEPAGPAAAGAPAASRGDEGRGRAATVPGAGRAGATAGGTGRAPGAPR